MEHILKECVSTNYLCSCARDRIQELEAALERGRNLIMKASPLAWDTGNYTESAHQWEKDAESWLKTAEQALKK
jgi:hypothetical protein